MLVRLVLSRFVDLAALLERGIMGFPFDFRVWWEGKNAPHRFPKLALAYVM